MIRAHIQYQGLESLHAELGHIDDALNDLSALAPELSAIMVSDNAEARSAGLDQRSIPFITLAPSTQKRRERQGRLGPPLAPDGPSSPIITDYTVEVVENVPGRLTLRGHWPNTPWVVYHQDNADERTKLPIRDPSGITPGGQEKVGEVWDRFVDMLASGRS
jgi:hypothetical protein